MGDLYGYNNTIPRQCVNCQDVGSGDHATKLSCKHSSHEGKVMFVTQPGLDPYQDVPMWCPRLPKNKIEKLDELRRLNDASAVHIMGWENCQGVYCIKIKECHYKEAVGHDGRVVGYDDWRPDKDANQRDMIENKMIEDAWHLSMTWNRHSRIYTCNLSRGIPYFSSWSKLKSKALIKACLKAKGIKL